MWVGVVWVGVGGGGVGVGVGGCCVSQCIILCLLHSVCDTVCVILMGEGGEGGGGAGMCARVCIRMFTVCLGVCV